MNRILTAVLLVMVLFAAPVGYIVAQDEVPSSLRDNRYYQESLRLSNLAQLAFDEGDYDASAAYSEEAISFAAQSDEYIETRIMIMRTDNAIAAARERLEYAASINAASRYSTEYNRAQSAFDEARAFRATERYEEAIAAAERVITALAYVVPEGTPPVVVTPVVTTQPPVTQTPTLPAQYTVRTWEMNRDALWNIAGYPWVYNDPWQWRTLYNANRHKMPQPDNPDLIHPGMILDIPSIKGETRQGMWNPNQTYPTFR